MRIFSKKGCLIVSGKHRGYISVPEALLRQPLKKEGSLDYGQFTGIKAVCHRLTAFRLQPFLTLNPYPFCSLYMAERVLCINGLESLYSGLAKKKTVYVNC